MHPSRWSVAAAALGLAWATMATPVGAAAAVPIVGNDISWPQCGHSYPTPQAFGIVGVTDGRPTTDNPCLVSEVHWAQRSGNVQFYVNTANPGVLAANAYDYGWSAARDAFAFANGEVSAGPGHVWWLDVETGNSWSPDQVANAAVISGSLALLRSKGVVVGIYSTRYQWNVITGGARFPSAPNWVPGALSRAQAPSWCDPTQSFSGGPVVMVQWTDQFDGDYACPGTPPPPAKPAPNLLGAILAWLSSL